MLAALVFPFAASAVIPDKPQPERLVNDLAGIFTPYQIDSLERELVAFDDSTSNQITVVTVSDLEDYTVAEYALRLGNKWGVGSNRNNGVIVLLKPRGTDGYVDVTIQVGRGLEGAIPDAYASRIIRNVMGPYLRQDIYFKPVALACEQLQALAAGEISEPRDDDDEDVGFAIFMVAMTMLLIIIVVIAIVEDQNKRGGGGSHYGGGRGPTVIIGRGNDFGGFSGGGFSGGGFSGGGFGGFGGGSFGGGGASGRF